MQDQYYDKYGLVPGEHRLIGYEIGEEFLKQITKVMKYCPKLTKKYLFMNIPDSYIVEIAKQTISSLYGDDVMKMSIENTDSIILNFKLYDNGDTIERHVNI